MNNTQETPQMFISLIFILYSIFFLLWAILQHGVSVLDVQKRFFSHKSRTVLNPRTPNLPEFWTHEQNRFTTDSTCIFIYLSLGSIFVFNVRIKNLKGQHCYHNDHIDDSAPSFFIALSAPRIPVSKQIGTKVKANLIYDLYFYIIPQETPLV